MKYIISSFYFLVTFLQAGAQSDSIVLSKLETFLMEPGRAVQIITSALGSLDRLDIGLLTVKDISNGEKRKAICFRSSSFLGESYFNVEDLHIDTADLDSLITFLKKGKTEVDKKAGIYPSVLRFTSSNLIVFSLENRYNNPERWDLFVYKRHKYINRPVDRRMASWRDKDMDSLLESLYRFQAFPRRND